MFFVSYSMFIAALAGCSQQQKKMFTVTFDGNGGTLISGEANQTVSKASELVEPEFELRGHNFDSWDVPLSTIVETTTVKAQWKIKDYTI